MEMQSVIEGLHRLDRPTRVDLYSDSQYVIKGISEWMEGWKQRGWRRANKGKVANLDLWKELDVLNATHDLTCHWVKGHDDHLENERCDALAVAARDAASARLEGL
jgi:ribonuclease HI